MSFKYYNLYNSVHKVSDVQGRIFDGWIKTANRCGQSRLLCQLCQLCRALHTIFRQIVFFSIRWNAPGRWKTKISTSFPQGLILYSPSNILMTVKEKSVHGGGSREKVCLGLLGLCVWDRIDVICVILKAWIVDEKTFAGKTKIKLCFHYIFSLSLSFHTIK